MSFGKVAHDLVMRMQKIDGDNYPEVCFFFSWVPGMGILFFVEMKVRGLFFFPQFLYV